MRLRKITAILLAAALSTTVLAGCSGGASDKAADTPAKTEAADDAATETAAKDEGEAAASGDVKEFSIFFAVPGKEINDGNAVQEEIASRIGAKGKFTWLTGQTAEEAVGTLIAGGEYPDMIDGSSGSVQLYEAGALVPLDDYLDSYPNLKNFWSESDWEKVRQEDGHIYWIPQFGNYYENVDATTIGGEAFWIQTRVLEWDGYPQIKTLDQYFDLLQRYNEANPTMEDGTPNIPYTILCDDWRYFCLENPPQFLAGYPNDGSVIVDTDTMSIVDYNTTDTAKAYFQKLNEMFKASIVDSESFTQIYDEYIAKLSTGRVLGMVDQDWNFHTDVTNALVQQGLDAQGCNYVPLSITMDESVEGRWYTAGTTIDVSNGIGITTSCDDVEGALQFLNDLLDPEIRILRGWGIEGVDYLVADDGTYYRTEEMRNNYTNEAYKAENLCDYNYLPNYVGMLADGINTAIPTQQPGEYFESLPADVQACLSKYGVQTYADMLGRSEIPGVWYPMWSYSNNLTTSTEGGKSWVMMGEIKHEYLPKVVMSDDFETGWNEYMSAYENCNPQAFLDEMQTELDRRVSLAQ